MKSIYKVVGQIAVRAALTAPTSQRKKERLMLFYQYGIIRPSLLQWSMAVYGLRGE